MKQKIHGLFIILIAIVCIGCKSPVAETPATETPATAADKTITHLAITGVVPPVRGATPVTTITETAQYTGTITWSGTPVTFASSTPYTANIVLTAKTGWTLNGVAANSFTVAGATTVTNAVNKGTVAAVFPATGPAADVDVVFSSVVQAGGAANSATTTSLTLNFSVDPSSLTASNITVTGATAGALTGSGTTRNLVISGITVADGAIVSVSVASPAGFAVTGSPKTAVVYKAPTGPTPGVGDYTSANIGTLKYVPAGSFQRDGITADISTINTAFHMSQYEITRAQFFAIMGTDPSNATYSSGTTDPVQNITWYHAITFCNKLSIKEGLTRVYDVTGFADDAAWTALSFASIPTTSNATWDVVSANWSANGYRLPTKMEWMWAAMGATGTGTNTTAYLKAFAGSTGSNAIGDYAVFGYSGSETGKTTTRRSNPVGGKLPNELGLYDMSGNVWEWNWDWYAGYIAGTLVSDAVDGSGRGAASGASRFISGGSWYNIASYCLMGYWTSNYPYTQYYFNGFRVVRP